jgi:hypothetical protein
MKIGNEHEKRAAPSPHDPRLETEGGKPRAGFPEDRVAPLGTEEGIYAIEVKHLDRDDGKIETARPMAVDVTSKRILDLQAVRHPAYRIIKRLTRKVRDDPVIAGAYHDLDYGRERHDNESARGNHLLVIDGKRGKGPYHHPERKGGAIDQHRDRAEPKAKEKIYHGKPEEKVKHPEAIDPARIDRLFDKKEHDAEGVYESRQGDTPRAPKKDNAQKTDDNEDAKNYGRKRKTITENQTNIEKRNGYEGKTDGIQRDNRNLTKKRHCFSRFKRVKQKIYNALIQLSQFHQDQFIGETPVAQLKSLVNQMNAFSRNMCYRIL